MPETTSSIWASRSPWANIAEAGRIGATGSAGVTALTLEGLGLATLIAAPGTTGLERAVKQLIDIELPQTPLAALSSTHGVIWTGPGKWLLLARQREGFSKLLSSLSADAAVADQSHACAALRLSGPRVREVLAKGSMVDLHPSSFPVQAIALTSFAHIGVQIWRAEDGPDGAVFEILVARSLAGSFWSWFIASAAEYGCDVATGRG
jgi:methylglutamate dehydrogenase subunit D